MLLDENKNKNEISLFLQLLPWLIWSLGLQSDFLYKCETGGRLFRTKQAGETGGRLL